MRSATADPSEKQSLFPIVSGDVSPQVCKYIFIFFSREREVDPNVLGLFPRSPAPRGEPVFARVVEQRREGAPQPGARAAARRQRVYTCSAVYTQLLHCDDVTVRFPLRGNPRVSSLPVEELPGAVQGSKVMRRVPQWGGRRCLRGQSPPVQCYCMLSSCIVSCFFFPYPL